VCRDGDLLKIDQHLSLFYTQAFTRADASRREMLLNGRAAFESWLDRCKTDSCIRGIYLARIREVKDVMAGNIKPSHVSQTSQQRAPMSPVRSPQEDASFGCRLAKTEAQTAVCQNEDLLKLDQHASLFYTQAFKNADAARRETLLRTRASFIARRDNCRSLDCVKGVYLGRIAEVRTIIGVRPSAPEQE
jgi:uncharacterized protein